MPDHGTQSVPAGARRGAVAPSPLATSSPLVHGRGALGSAMGDGPVGRRRAGVLLHVTSLAGPDGIGDLGAPSREFVDWLASAGQRLWHVLPLHPPANQSWDPYDSSSAFAGNPLLINLDELVTLGLLPNTLSAIRSSVGAGQEPGDQGPQSGAYMVSRTARWKLPLVRQAARQLLSLPPDHELTQLYLAFCSREAAWLADHVAFTTVREQHPGVARSDWPVEHRVRPHGPIERRADSVGPTHQHPEAAAQFLFDMQLRALRAHARERDVWMMVDTPFYVADDSADVWANPELFLLDEEHRPSVRTGAPPDETHPAGQLWPMPAYAWPAHESSAFDWWSRRLGRESSMADVVQLEHLRALGDWWCIPARAGFGEQGRWEPGPGAALLEAARSTNGDMRLVVDDSGQETPALSRLRETAGLPLVRVLVRGYEEGGASAHLPTSWTGDEAAYTAGSAGTVLAWAQAAQRDLETSPEDDRLAFAMRFAGAESVGALAQASIELVMRSAARYAIVPLQDWLGVVGEQTVGVPGAARAEWRWRAPDGVFTEELADELRAAVDRARRRKVD